MVSGRGLALVGLLASPDLEKNHRGVLPRVLRSRATDLDLSTGLDFPKLLLKGSTTVEESLPHFVIREMSLWDLLNSGR